MIDSELMDVHRIRQQNSYGSLRSVSMFKVQSRDPDNHKVDLGLYRRESKKIFEILKRYSNVIEKGGTDEAFIQVNQQVDFHLKLKGDSIDYAKDEGTEDFWEGAYFMGFGKKNGVANGAFVPETLSE